MLTPLFANAIFGYALAGLGVMLGMIVILRPAPRVATKKKKKK